MAYFTTPLFFVKFRALRRSENVPVSKLVWLRNLYAFASRYKILSDKQFDVLQDIGWAAGFIFTQEEIFEQNIEGDHNEMV